MKEATHETKDMTRNDIPQEQYFKNVNMEKHNWVELFAWA